MDGKERKAAASSGMMGWDGIGSEHKKIQTQGTHAHVASIKHGGPRAHDRQIKGGEEQRAVSICRLAAAKKATGDSCRSRK